MEQNKIFDEFPHVDCNDCELYWINQCDGVQKAQKRTCNSFKASRSVVIPLQIKWLQTRLKWLVGALVLLGILQIGMLIIIIKYYFGIF